MGRSFKNGTVLFVLLVSLISDGATYSFQPPVCKRRVKAERTYDIALSIDKWNAAYIPAMMSFYGATNEQIIINSELEYSVAPDSVTIESKDYSTRPRKFYRLIWNKASVGVVRVQEHLTIDLICRNKLCTKAVCPYPPEVLERFKEYLGNDEDEKINLNNDRLDTICTEIRKKSKSAEDTVERVCDWINDLITYERGKSVGSDEILTNRKGNSVSQSRLACAMLRKLQIPCDVVDCKYIEGNGGFTVIEVYFPDAGWVFYDVAYRERGFKSLDCLMTAGYSFAVMRGRGDSQQTEWANGHFLEYSTLGRYKKQEAVRTKPLRTQPEKKDVLGVKVAPITPPASIKIRRQPLKELILDNSIPPGIREYSAP